MSPKSARICGQAPINPHKPPCFTPQKGKIGFSDVKLEKKSRKNLQNPKNRINFALANGTIASPTKKNDSVAQLVEQMTQRVHLLALGREFEPLRGHFKRLLKVENDWKSNAFSHFYLLSIPQFRHKIEVCGVRIGNAPSKLLNLHLMVDISLIFNFL